jgi:large subunit ribosomal protein L4
MKLDLVNTSKKKVGELEISDEVLVKEPNLHLAHQLLLLQHTRPFRNALTKTKGEVRGGGAKPWKQKGTGRARAGSTRSPLWRGGGVTFGPRFHQITVKMPKRARLKALCSALSAKTDQLVVLDSLPVLAQPKTKEALALINTFAENKKVLVIIDQNNEDFDALYKSLSNLPKCRVIHWQNLNVHDLFNSEVTITDQIILKNIEGWLIKHKLRKGVLQEEAIGN